MILQNMLRFFLTILFCISFILAENLSEKELINIGAFYEKNDSMISFVSFFYLSLHKNNIYSSLEGGVGKSRYGLFSFAGNEIINLYQRKLQFGYYMYPEYNNNDNIAGMIFYPWLGSTVRLKDSRPFFFRLHFRREGLLFMIATPLFW
jgi:hypothetical protein